MKAECESRPSSGNRARIKPGVVTDIGSTLDLLPTFCALAGVNAPTDRVLDGYDLSAALLGKGRSPRQTMFYWRGSKLYAVRNGSFKAHFITQSEYGGEAGGVALDAGALQP